MSEPTEEELRQRLARGSRDLDDYCDLADLLTASGRRDEALSVLETALDFPLAAIERARMCGELGWKIYDTVLDGVNRALSLAHEAIALLAGQPDGPETLLFRGAARSLLAHCQWGSDDQTAREAARLAVADLEHVIQDQPESQAFLWAPFDAARVYMLLDDGARAVQCFQRFLTYRLTERDRFSGLTWLGEACLQAGRLQEADQAVAEALPFAETWPVLLPALYHTRALIHLAAGRRADACRAFEATLAALEGHPLLREAPELLKSIHGNLGDIYYDAGDYEKAASAYRHLLACYPEGDPAHPSVLHWLGQCAVGVGDYGEARRFFEAVLASPCAPDAIREAAERELISASAHAARIAGDDDAAAQLFARLLGRHPNDDEDRRRVLMWLGHSMYSLDRYDDALACYDEVRSSPHTGSDERAEAEEWVDWSAGQRQYETGEYGEAAASFERLVERYPEDHSFRCTALMWLAGCYEALGASTGAQDCYQAVVRSRQATEAQRTEARAGLTRLA